METPRSSGDDVTGAPDRPAPWWRRLVALLTGMLGGVTVAALALVITEYLLFDSGAELLVHALVFSALTLVPAAALWITHTLLWRSLAVCLTGSWAAVLVLVLVWHPWTTMSSEERDDATAAIVAADVPALYLGEEADGYGWNEYYLGEDGVDFLYGECHASPDDEGCADQDWDIAVLSYRTDVLRGGDALAGCQRLDPVLGVLTVSVDDAVVLFTGGSQVTLTTASPNLARQVALAGTLHSVGGPEQVTQLPPPNAVVLDYVERHCAA